MSPRTRAVAAVAVLIALFSACASAAGPKPVAGLDARTATIGGLQVTATPTQLDSAGAAFTLAFDTHTGAPTIDIVASSTLTVDGAMWVSLTWQGDGPGGHHRSGTLRFAAGGPARGIARLDITGLDQPLELTWQLAT